MRVLAALVLFGVMATPAPAATKVVRWSPFIGETLRPGLVATPAFGGDCFTGSFAVHNAYRCADGNFLRDPCFADPTRDDAVLCVRDPFSRGAVRLRVSGNLDRSGSAPPGLVWALRLANGQRCTFFAGGATGADAAGRRANYGCSGRQTILWGTPIRRGRTWRIRLSHSFTPGPERLAAIRTAYIGVG
jgi:hypothetical protein